MTTPQMTPERFARIREIYLAAGELSGDELDDYLQTACPDDRQLQAEVRELLALGDPSEKPVDDLISGVARGLAESIALEQTIDAVGPYRILDTLGRGGMGTVYLAERADGQFRQRVAIKVVDRNRSTPELVSRFRSERQILASLDHPHVARLFDGGETDDGVPYLVMEYVDGIPVDRYCDEHRLSIAERLGLFLEVCSAIEYAHRNLIVHRDVKPSNILVTEDGTPKLLDFGIAKLLRPESIDYTVAVTVGDVRLMTPKNASPEQIRGETITTATDIYSLGVLLYQLLTGHFPYTASGTQAYELERLICESDPTRPSTVVTRPADEEIGDESQRTPESISKARRLHGTAQLRKQLRGDLDNIVMVAMRKEPERRYATVRQFAEDVRSYLEHRPVRARGDSMAYRTGKFLRRNPGGVALVGSTVALVAILVTAYTYRLAEERDRAELEAAKATEVTRFMTQLFKEADPRQSTGEAVTVTTMLDRGAERIVSELDDQPELQASLMATIGESYHNMWELGKAREHLAASLETAESRLGESHPDVIRMRYVLGMTISFQGDFAEALPMHEKNYDLQVAAHGRRSAEAAKELHQVAFIQSETGQYEQAETNFTEVIGIFRDLGDAGRQGLATGLMEYGTVLRKVNRLEEDADAQLEALEIRRQLHGENHPDYVLVLNNVGNNYYARGLYDEAGRYMRDNVRLSKEIFGPKAIPYAVALSNLSNLEDERGNYARALELRSQVEPIYRAGYGEDHPRYAYLLENTAATMTIIEDYAGAEAYFQRTMDILSKTFAEDHFEVGITRSRYGEMLRKVGRYDEAVEQLQMAYDSMRDGLGDTHGRTLYAQNQLGLALHGAGRHDEAIEVLSAELDAAGQAPPHLRSQQIVACNSLATVYRDRQDFEKARSLLREAIAIWEDLGVKENPSFVYVDEAYADTLLKLGEERAAVDHLRDRYETFVAEFGAGDQNTIRLADALDDLGAGTGDSR